MSRLERIRRDAGRQAEVMIEADDFHGRRPYAICRPVSKLWPKDVEAIMAVVEAAIAWGKSTTPRDDMTTESALIDALKELGGDDIC